MTTQRPRRGLSPGIRWSALVLTAILGAAAVGEVLAREFYPKPWFETLLEQQLPNTPPHREMNALGLRDRPVGPRSRSPELRVLMLGDSFTYGSGVDDEQAVFPRVVERSLSGRFPVPVRVLNGGLPGSQTPQWVRLLEGVGPLYQPDAIVAVFFLRDGTPLSTMTDFFGPVRGAAYDSRETALYRWSYLYRVFADLRTRREIGSRYSDAIRRSYFGSAEERRNWTRAQKNLREMAAYARRRRASFGLVVFPMLLQLDEHYPFQDVEREVADFGRRSGWPTLDLLPAFLGRSAPDLWCSGYNQHPNARGHAVAAAAIGPFVEGLLRERLKLDPAAGR